MNDQVQALEARGVAATFLSATLDGEEVRRRMARMASGAFKIVYVAPERLAFPGFRGLLQEIQIPLVAVDEAHCISEWGHDFRPDYLQIGELIAEIRGARVLACTATATPVVRDEILARLGLGSETPQIVRASPAPTWPCGWSRWAMRGTARPTSTPSWPRPWVGPARAAASPSSTPPPGAGPRRRRRGWRTGAGGRPPTTPDCPREARETASRAFAEGTVEVVAATVAFGMGIDRPDVRAVVHLAPPGSIEAYYQEVGRAGRDGAPAWGLLLVSPGDMALRRRLLERGDGADPEVVEHKWSLFLELMRWAEGGSCRHDAILRYFGDEAETLSGCGRCDACQRLSAGEEAEDPEAVTLLVRKALSAVARVHERFGLTAAVKLLRGARGRPAGPGRASTPRRPGGPSPSTPRSGSSACCAAASAPGGWTSPRETDRWPGSRPRGGR